MSFVGIIPDTEYTLMNEAMSLPLKAVNLMKEENNEKVAP